MHTIWTGERVRLRPIKDADEMAWLQHEASIEPNEFWGPWWEPLSRTRKDYETAGMLDPTEYSQFAIERLDTGAAVGIEEFGGMHPGSVRAWVGTYMTREHWGRGFGVEAKQLCYCFLFENFPLQRVDATTVENHLRAARGLKQSGMSYEGRWRKCQFTDGHYYDIVQYAIYREQWEQLPIRQIVKRG